MKAKHQYQKINIGRNLQKIRRTLGFTQEQVAESLELAPRYISDIERDKTKGSLDTLVKLCNLYHVSPTYVLKDYLNTADTRNINDIIIGFSHLEDDQKDIVRELIAYMNSKKRKTTTKALNDDNLFSDVDPDSDKAKSEGENSKNTKHINSNSNSDSDLTIERDLRSITLVEVKPKPKTKRKANSTKKKINKN